MKKNLLLLLLAGFMLAGCESEYSYTPKHGGKYVPWEEEEDEEAAPEPEEKFSCVYKFYFSYSHSSKYDEVLGKEVATPIIPPITHEDMFVPLGACPEEIDTKEELLKIAADEGIAVDETFNKFLGFSQYTVCLDEEGLWDFTKDTKQQAIINLYGIWVSE